LFSIKTERETSNTVVSKTERSSARLVIEFFLFFGVCFVSDGFIDGPGRKYLTRNSNTKMMDV